MHAASWLTDWLNDGAASYTPGVSEHRGGATKFYHGDRQGTNGHETDSTQAVTSTKVYDAFGLLVSSSGSSSSPFGYVGAQGYQEDGDSGLKLLGHRYYDPSTGRFLTRDHVKDGRNWFGYCENNPVRFVDVNGFIYVPSWRDVLTFVTQAVLPSCPATQLINYGIQWFWWDTFNTPTVRSRMEAGQPVTITGNSPYARVLNTSIREQNIYRVFNSMDRRNIENLGKQGQ